MKGNKMDLTKIKELVDIKSEYIRSFVLRKTNKKRRRVYYVQKGSSVMPKIKDLQKTLSLFKTHKNAIAYTKNVNARKIVKDKHSKLTFHYKYDFSKFFESFTLKKTWKLCKKWGFTESELGLLYSKIENVYRLMIGDVNNPKLTNMLMYDFDKDITKIIEEKFNGEYSRYADDILISLNVKLAPDKIEDIILQALKRNKLSFLKLNKEKTQHAKLGGKLFFLGLSINKQYGIGIGHKRMKNIRNNIRAIAFRVNKDPEYDTTVSAVNLLNKLQYINSVYGKEIVNIAETKMAFLPKTYEQTYNMGWVVEAAYDFIKSKYNIPPRTRTTTINKEYCDLLWREIMRRIRS